MDPWNNREAWNGFYLAGVPSPGILMQIPEPSNPADWDKKKPTGASGASTTYQGTDVASFSFVIWLLDEEHYEDWQMWKQLLGPPSKNWPNALDIQHPILNMVARPITSVFVENHTVRLVNTHIEVKIDFCEFRKPVPAQAKPKASTDNKDSTTSGPMTEQERLVAGALGTFTSLL